MTGGADKLNSRVPPGANMRAAALRWLAWATVDQLVRDGLRIGGRLLLARFLLPEAFGVYTLAVTVVVGLQTLCQLHFQALVVRRPSLTPTLVATAYWSQVALGALGTLALLLGADFVGTVLGDPRVAPVLQVLGVQLFLGGLAAVPRAWLVRQLAFRRLAHRSLISESGGIVVGVAAALAGTGVWSLVIQDLVVTGLDMVVVWSMVPWRPQRRWRFPEFLELVDSGSPLVGTRAVQYVADQGDRLLVGRGFGSEIVGFYAIGSRLVEVVSEGLGFIVRQVAFPAFAQAQDDLQRTARGFLEAVRFQALVVFPLLMSLTVLADTLVPLVLGPLWIGAIAFTQIFAARALLNSLGMLPRALLLARGRQWLLFRLSLLNLAACAVGCVLGFAWGPLGVASGSVAATLVVVVVTVRLAISELSLRFAEWTRSLLPPVVGTATMAAGMILVPRLMPGAWPAEGLLRAAMLLLVGVVCYVLPLAPWLVGEARRQRGALAAVFTADGEA